MNSPVYRIDTTLGLALIAFLNCPCVFAGNLDKPEFNFDIYNIKTPQLIGILFGFVVFTVTISSVCYLLYSSGTFRRLQEELQSGKQISFGRAVSKVPQVFEQPELYDHLIEASRKLPLKVPISEIKGKGVILKPLTKDDYNNLFIVGNGSAQFHESSYDPERLWGWLYDFHSKTNKDIRPYTSIESFELFLKEKDNSKHFTITDIKLQKIVGMVSLTNNDPQNLSIQLDNFWITPSFQGLKKGHEAALLLLTELNELGYRRITAEVDSRHLIGRKFLERIGFRTEAILRKHRIICDRNRDTALFTMVNSDWEEISLALKKYLGYPVGPIKHKIAEIDTPQEALLKPQQVTSANSTSTSKIELDKKDEGNGRGQSKKIDVKIKSNKNKNKGKN